MELEAQDLMLHDLVEWNGIVCEVTKNQGDDGLELYDREKGRHYYVKDGFKPIALTEETFKLNGWKRTGYGWMENPNEKKLHVYYEWDSVTDEDGHFKDFMTNFSVFGISGFKWVHEFQNYLRLVERKYIANNFKV